jgi:hypothetical protein
MKYFFFPFSFILLISCDQNKEQKLLPYGYYEDKHWGDIETYGLKGNVKSRESYYVDLYEDKYSILDTTPELYQVLKFDKKGYLTFRKGYERRPIYDSDTTSVTINYYYPEDKKSEMFSIIRTDSNQSIFTWENNKRIKKIEYQNLIAGKYYTNSSIKYEYLNNTSLRTKVSRFEKNNSLISYINFNFDDNNTYLGWDQYWGNPLRLVESLKVHYDKNNQPIATTSYDAIDDSIKPFSYHRRLHINSLNLPIDFNHYNKDSTVITAATTYKYDRKNRLIYKEYRNKENNQFEIEEYEYENDRLLIEKNTRWEPARDTVQNKSVMKYDNNENIIEKTEYLNPKRFSKIVHKLKYYED